MARIYKNIVNNLYEREIALHRSPRIVESYFALSKEFYRADLQIHKACVNGLDFSNDGLWLASGGDDLQVMISNVEQSLQKHYRPLKCKMRHRGNIFCLAFNQDATRVFSGGTDELIIHDTSNGDVITSRFLDCSAICGIAAHPQDANTIAICTEDGRLQLFDCRSNATELTENFLPENAYKSIQYNPTQPHLLLVASNTSTDDDVCLIDSRNSKIVFSYLSPFSKMKGAMTARYNTLGNQILVMRNHVSSSLYNSNNSTCVCEFNSFGYYSSITQKNVCFFGQNDEYACIPSDDFSIYLFRIPDDLKNISANDKDEPMRFVDSTFVLKGHRSIVNQVHFNKSRSILSSSGVENTIKYWSPFPINFDDEIKKENLSNSNSNDRILNPYPMARTSVLDLYSDEESSNPQPNATNEDTVVLNFFDNLIRRNFCEEGEFFDFSEDKPIEKFKVIDSRFDRDLHFIRSLIIDHNMKHKERRAATIKEVKREQLEDKKRSQNSSSVVVASSLSFLFNHKKIKQSKIIIERAYRLIQDRLRFIRKCKRQEISRNDDFWQSNVQTMVAGEPELKKMLLDLNEVYKEKRILKSISADLYTSLIKRLQRLYFRRPIVRNYLNISLSSESNSSDHSFENAHLTQFDEVQSSDSNESMNSSITLTDDSLSDDSLSAGSVLDNEQSDGENRRLNRNLKRKKIKSKNSRRISDNHFKFNLPKSSSDSENSCASGIRKFKKSRIKSDKTKNCNIFAFDSDLDLDPSTSSSQSNELYDEIRHEIEKQACTSSASKKRPFVKTTNSIEEDVKEQNTDYMGKKFKKTPHKFDPATDQHSSDDSQSSQSNDFSDVELTAERPDPASKKPNTDERPSPN